MASSSTTAEYSTVTAQESKTTDSFDTTDSPSTWMTTEDRTTSTTDDPPESDNSGVIAGVSVGVVLVVLVIVGIVLFFFCRRRKEAKAKSMEKIPREKKNKRKIKYPNKGDKAQSEEPFPRGGDDQDLENGTVNLAMTCDDQKDKRISAADPRFPEVSNKNRAPNIHNRYEQTDIMPPTTEETEEPFYQNTAMGEVIYVNTTGAPAQHSPNKKMSTEPKTFPQHLPDDCPDEPAPEPPLCSTLASVLNVTSHLKVPPVPNDIDDKKDGSSVIYENFSTDDPRSDDENKDEVYVDMEVDEHIYVN